MNKDLSDVLISGESEDYTIDDVITIGGLNQTKPLIKDQSEVKSNEPVKVVLSENKKAETDLKELENIDISVKALISNFSSTISPNFNKFVSITKCDDAIKNLYGKLETISQNRGSAKEIIQIGSNIQSLEDEKNKQDISNIDIDKTIESIKNGISVLGKLKNILESNKKG